MSEFDIVSCKGYLRVNKCKHLEVAIAADIVHMLHYVENITQQTCHRATGSFSVPCLLQ